jgi:hypothetical protein
MASGKKWVLADISPGGGHVLDLGWGGELFLALTVVGAAM